MEVENDQKSLLFRTSSNRIQPPNGPSSNRDKGGRSRRLHHAVERSRNRSRGAPPKTRNPGCAPAAWPCWRNERTHRATGHVSGPRTGCWGIPELWWISRFHFWCQKSRVPRRRVPSSSVPLNKRPQFDHSAGHSLRRWTTRHVVGSRENLRKYTQTQREGTKKIHK